MCSPPPTPSALERLRSTRIGRLAWIAVACPLLCPSAVTGQTVSTATGVIAGTVSDPTRAVLPGVTVTLSSAALMGTRTARTTDGGLFRPIPVIYAIPAAGGIQPDVATLACPPGSVCVNHPGMIDASRVLGPGATNIKAVPHSHVIGDRRAGWFHTVNIRVTDLAVWTEIATAKSLAKVRELQADPAIGGQGKISADTPTNVFFFIASWR